MGVLKGASKLNVLLLLLLITKKKTVQYIYCGCMKWMEDTSTFIIEKHLTINQGKNISIAYNGDRFVEILSVQHFVKINSLHLEMA